MVNNPFGILKFSRDYPKDQADAFIATFQKYEEDFLQVVAEYQVTEAFFHYTRGLYFSNDGQGHQETGVAVYHRGVTITNAESASFVDHLEILLERDSNSRVMFIPSQVFYPLSESDTEPLNRRS